MSGFRGSNSDQASAYKKQGHADEATFSRLIGGVVKTKSDLETPNKSGPDGHIGKTDVIGPDGKKYTVKGAKKKWQIFLYGYARLKNDIDFQAMNGIGQLFLESLDCFPADYSTYLKDKISCKKILDAYIKRHPGEKALKDEAKLADLLPKDNEYFISKLKLKDVTTKIKDKLSDRSNLRLFLDKAMFNLAEVDRIAIKKGSDFLVFEKDDVLDILTESFEVQNSKSGNRKTDLNIDGQKILMTHSTNVVEIEIRNDSDKHYRQLRFNMLKDKALSILEANTEIISDWNKNVRVLRKKSN